MKNEIVLKKAILIAITCVLASSLAHADKATAKQLFLEGTRLYDVGEHAKALDSFKRAYLNYEEPVLLFNMAQCYRGLGNKQEAIKAYKSYLRKAPEAENRAVVLGVITSLEVALEQEAKAASIPPQGTILPSGSQGEHTLVEPKTNQTDIDHLVASQPAPATRVPVYRKWWFWTPIVLVVAAGVGVGVGVGLTSNNFSATLPPISRTSGLSVQF